MRELRRSMLLVFVGFFATAVGSDDESDELKAIRKIELLGGTVRMSITLPDHPVAGIRFQGQDPNPFKPQRPIRFNDKHVPLLRVFPSLTSISFVNTDVTDDGLAHLKEFHNLTFLSLEGTAVTDKGMRELAVLDTLTSLNLNRTKITDEGLNEICKLINLTNLCLNNTQITDEGVANLSKLTNLEFLELRGAKVTAEGRRLLLKSLPNTRIELNADRRFDGLLR